MAEFSRVPDACDLSQIVTVGLEELDQLARVLIREAKHDAMLHAMFRSVLGDATENMIESSERSGPGWAVARAPGKWSPSQIVEHVARSLEESANMATGRPSKFPGLPALVYPVVRGLLFRRVLRNAAFPKARTN
jgi:hypothetical protein